MQVLAAKGPGNGPAQYRTRHTCGTFGKPLPPQSQGPGVVHGEVPPGSPHRTLLTRGRFAEYDKDKDGQITLEELEGALGVCAGDPWARGVFDAFDQVGGR